MPNILADRVLESSVSAGTGVFTLAGAVLGFRAFSAVCAVTDTMPYYIEAVDALGRPTGEWEFGLGTYSAANQLTRTTIRGSSNAGLAVAFSAGTKLVGLGIAAPNTTATRLEWRAALGLTAVGDAVATAANAAAGRAALGLAIGADVLAPNGSGAALTGIGGRVAQIQRSFSGAVATGTTATPWDDSAPQITEGDQYYTVTITPQNASSLLEIDVVMNVSCSSIAQSTVALHQDSIADALAATPAYSPAAGQPAIGVIKYFVTAGSTTARTYRVRVGNNGAGTVTINGSNGTRRYGGVMQSGISVREILP